MINVGLANLYALRAHLETVIMAAEAAADAAGQIDQAAPGGCPKCGAPADQVEDATMLDGLRKSRCLQCGQVWES